MYHVGMCMRRQESSQGQLNYTYSTLHMHTDTGPSIEATGHSLIVQIVAPCKDVHIPLVPST